MGKVSAQAFLRFGIAILTTACVAALGRALLYWSLTDTFTLATTRNEAVDASSQALLAAFALCVASFAALAFTRRLPVRRVELLATAAIFGAVVAYVAVTGPNTLWIIPAATVALTFARKPAGPSSRVAVTFLASGLVIWSWLVLRGADDDDLTRSRPTLSPAIIGGVTMGRELWLLDTSGRVTSFDPNTRKIVRRVRSGAMALVRGDRSMWVLLSARDRDGRPATGVPFGLASYRAGKWRSEQRIPAVAGEQPLTLAGTPDAPIVLTSRRLIAMDGRSGRTTATPLSDPIEAGPLFSPLVVGTSLYLGSNMGEWGGGLRRIDRATGRVTTIERKDRAGICAEPLDRMCDPITALVRDDRRPACLYAAVGLDHMMWHGRVLRICGDRVATVFSRPFLPIAERLRRLMSARARSFSPETEPVFGLLPSPGGFTAITTRGLYHWKDDKIERIALPRLSSFHGMALATDVPGIIIIGTDANAATSLSGTTPSIFAAPGS